jgi:para-aminobenzoate synthetase component 1
VELAIVRDGTRTLTAVRPAEVVRANGADAFDVLDAIDGGWWAGFVSYDLGRAVERVPTLAAIDPVVPDLLLARFEGRVEGLDHRPEHPHPPLGAWRSSLDREAWIAGVKAILEHEVAGDCYQVNLTRRLECDGEPDPLALHTALARGNPAPHAALLQFDDIAVVSASPERFLRVDRRRIETRPIKGTGRDPEALRRSEKDRAENVMIVDLARNDLGRVCEYGSIEVPGLCEVEAHPGLFHLVSTITGELRPDATRGDVLRATFPPASVTGCPKPRVLEIIEQLEPVRRGVYCGAVGFIDADNGVMDWNVAIRTFTITGGTTYFGVGAGIVADSDPEAEWDETELKASRLLKIASSAPR